MSEIFKTNIQFNQYSRQSPKRVNFFVEKKSVGRIIISEEKKRNYSFNGIKPTSA